MKRLHMQVDVERVDIIMCLSIISIIRPSAFKCRLLYETVGTPFFLRMKENYAGY